MKCTESFSDRSHPLTGYQQTLCDFAIAELIEKLKDFYDSDLSSAEMVVEEPEVEHLAALLIHQLSVQLDGRMLAGYLHVLRNAGTWTIVDLPKLELKPSRRLLPLPTTFPDQTPAPRFEDGDRVRWQPLLTDTVTNGGIVMGHFFAFAQHRGQWAWKYLIWLKDAAPVLADTAWEEDLQPLTEEGDP